MAACSRVAHCPFFKTFATKASLRAWQAYYCEGDWGRCERWKLLADGGAPPESLLPNGRTIDVPLDRLSPEHMR